MFPNGSDGTLGGFGRGGRAPGRGGRAPGRGGGRAPGRGGGRAPGCGGGDGRGNGRGRGAAEEVMGRGRGRGRANNQASINALLAQESRRLMPVLNPNREDGTIWFGLDNEPRRAIVAAIRRHFDGAWNNMGSVPNWGLIQWWVDFIQCFYWDEAHGDQVYRLWYQVVAARLGNMVSKAKISGKRPDWISSEIWAELWEYWNSEEGKKKSKIASANRLSERDGFGPHAHTSGARSYEQLRDLIRRKEGIEPSMLRILRDTHRKSDGTYVDQKAQSIDADIQRQIDERIPNSDSASQEQTGGTSLSSLDEDEIFFKTVSPKNGRIFGLGRRNNIRERGESSRSRAVSRISLKRQVTSLQERLASVVEYMKNYMAKGGSNSTTNKTQGTNASLTCLEKTNNPIDDDPDAEPADAEQEEDGHEDIDPEDVNHYYYFGDDYGGGAAF